MEHRPHSAYLASHDFFLFDAMKVAFAEQHFDVTDDLFMGLEVFLGGLFADFLQTVF
jgi:hypothetical protein